jgi:hypothetical protein
MKSTALKWWSKLKPPFPYRDEPKATDLVTWGCPADERSTQWSLT